MQRRLTTIEEYYYLFWAPVVLWMRPIRAAKFAAIICCVAIAVRWLGSQGTAAYFSIYNRFDAPVFGSLIAILIASEISRRKVKLILLTTGLVGIAVLSAVVLPMGNVFGREIRQDHSFMVFGVPSLSLIAAAIIGISVTTVRSPILFFLRSSALRFFGKISYTLYLLHGFVYLCFLRFFALSWSVSIAALFCAVLLSWLSWTYFEQPILEDGKVRRARGSNQLETPSMACAADPR